MEIVFWAECFYKTFVIQIKDAKLNFCLQVAGCYCGPWLQV
jgi:hypothetical protein